MDRPTQLARLSEAQLHVLQATEHVKRQRKLIAVLEKDGPRRLLPEAMKLLRQLESRLALYVEDRDRLAKDLANADPSHTDTPKESRS